jgi:GT2 family glycosyltransferase
MSAVPKVSVGIVTWNCPADIAACVPSVRAQTWPNIELLIGDNASTDNTRDVVATLTRPEERVFFDTNKGFTAGHNALMDRTTGDFYVCLNPDVVLDPDYVRATVQAMIDDPRAGSATGKLLRKAPSNLIDTTGIVMTRDQRHLDRGADTEDVGQYEVAGEVFGASGAAAVYRRAMLEDTRVSGEYFDDDFFTYREDADLSWRARLCGWTCLYVPAARGRHVRLVTPGRRSKLPAWVNRSSVRNRFLLRIKNQTFGHAVRFLIPALVRDAQVVGYVVLREWSSLPGLADVIRLFPRMLRKRRIIMRHRRASSRDLARWFTNDATEKRERSSGLR